MMTDDEFGDDVGDELPQFAPRLPQRKKKGQSSKPAGKGGGQPEQAAQAPPPVVGYGLGALFMVPLLGIAIFMAVRQRGLQEGEERAFAAEIDQLLKPPKEGTSPAGKPGRFAEIDVDERALCHSHWTLWKDMRAATPAEADYIVHVHTIRDKVGEYTDATNAIKLTLELTVIDKPTWTVVGRKTFVGSEPPLIVSGSDGSTDNTGDPPDRQEVIAYYRGLAGMQ